MMVACLRRFCIILSSCVVGSRGFLPDPVTVTRGSYSTKYIGSTAPCTVAESSISEATDVTHVVPRFFNGEVADGSYPSPLHSIHMIGFLSELEVKTCRKLANEHAAATGRWNKPDQDRHSSYPTCDFPVEDSDDLASFLEEINFDVRMWNALSERFEIPIKAMSYLDLFCAHYRAQSGEGENNPNVMDRLEEHRDGSLLSFIILLTPTNDFEGGGTFFDALRDSELPGSVVKPQRSGDACLHSGKILHGADVVTRGERTVLVGFVDVADWCQREGVLSAACRDFGRMDVASFRHKRQQAKTKDGSRGWFFDNTRWLSGDVNARSVISAGFCPAFTSVSRRAEKGFQRRKKLESEDIFLRRILHPDRHKRDDLFFDDITIL